MLYREDMVPPQPPDDPWANSKERHTGTAGRQDLWAQALSEGLVARSTEPASLGAEPAPRHSGAEGTTFFAPAAGPVRRRPWTIRSGRDRRAEARTASAGTGPDGLDRRAQRDGAEDEQIAVSESGVVVLRSERVIAVTESGVTVLRSERAKGSIHTRIRRHGEAVELRDGWHDLTADVRRVAMRAAEVRRLLDVAPWGIEVPVRPMLCLTGGEWNVTAPLEIEGVWVGPAHLAPSAMVADPVLDAERVDAVRRLLAPGGG